MEGINPIVEIVLEILKYTLPSIIVLLTSYLVLKSMLNSELKKVQLNLRMANQKDVMPIRLQAYERLALLLERITPHNLIPRVSEPGMTARQLQAALVANIRAEYEHNIAQQIYVSPKSWDTVTLVKDEMIKTINLLATAAPENASGKDLSKRIFEYFLDDEVELPTQKALDILKREVLQLY